MRSEWETSATPMSKPSIQIEKYEEQMSIANLLMSNYLDYNWQIGKLDASLFANFFQMLSRIDQRVHVVLVTIAKMRNTIRLSHCLDHHFAHAFYLFVFVLFHAVRHCKSGRLYLLVFAFLLMFRFAWHWRC